MVDVAKLALERRQDTACQTLQLGLAQRLLETRAQIAHRGESGETALARVAKRAAESGVRLGLFEDGRAENLRGSAHGCRRSAHAPASPDPSSAGSSNRMSSISYSRAPDGLCTVATSPTFLPINALASGEVTEM